ncbi:uncharacterized protein TA08920 [Theileria annulata]|uniref:Rab-GAP TBC domain-containing protein n=1 Tax=Theileria annulata TaxID=5874 RepID=Q4U9E0_THEAN|nr:uncharacterized protein TA08920 [Theileria annulata]CAI76563.1 hypothetical protein TA08920 [Theileria annulata]|eukprot:XP_953188.1 hypothetical protein TA08920 [Theileria annulata]
MEMKKCRKKSKRKRSKLNLTFQKITNDIQKVFLSTFKDELGKFSFSNCDCGCSRTIKSIQSTLIKNYFTNKDRWIRYSGVSLKRISELSDISEIILTNGCNENTINSLDLHLVKSDISRQPWVGNTKLRDLAEKSIYLFCIYNNVPYWQGIHDIAAALAHLDPTPTVAELAGLLEQLIKTYASILFLPTNEEINKRADGLSRVWMLLFKYFFPKFVHRFEMVCDSPFCIGWFVTLGFYRFGCAYISLAYTFLLFISNCEPLSAFIFRELAYVATRGYINFLIKNAVSVDFSNSVIFNNYSSSNLIVSTILNSNKIYLDPEEFINVSRNMYDSIGEREIELAEFPLLYILNASNILSTSAPNPLTVDPSKPYLEVLGYDVFGSNHHYNTINSQVNPTQYYYDQPISRKSSIEPSYLGMKRINRGLKRTFKRFRVDSATISECINSELLYCYLETLSKMSNLYRHSSAKINENYVKLNDFEVGSILNPSLFYNIIDSRSQYLTTGIPLSKIFGEYRTNFMNKVSVDDEAESSFLDTNFTLWIVLTDEGYETTEEQYSWNSLRNGVEIMENLVRNSITCVSILSGGYKGILKALNSPVPQIPSLLSRLSARMLSPWDTQSSPITGPSRTTVTKLASPSISATKNLLNLASSVVNSALDIENRIVQGISEVKLFNRFIHSAKTVPEYESASINKEFQKIEISKSVSHTDFEGVPSYYNRINIVNPLISCCLYSIKLTTPNGLTVTIRSNGTLKLNGKLVHKSKYSNSVVDKNLNALVSISTMLTVNCVDRIMDTEPLAYDSYKSNTSISPFFKIMRERFLTKFMVLFTQSTEFADSRTPFQFNLSPKSFSRLEFLSNVAGLVSNVRVRGIAKLWRIYLVDRNAILSHLLFPSPRFDLENLMDSNVRYLSSSCEQELFTPHDVDFSRSPPDSSFHKFQDFRNIKVFSRTNQYRSASSIDSNQSSNSPRIETRVYVSNGIQIPFKPNSNVFVSRSSLNRRNNSRLS